MAHKHFECPHCEAPVPVALEDLMAASAVLHCPGCARRVIVVAGKLSNYQLPDGEDVPASYDSGD